MVYKIYVPVRSRATLLRDSGNGILTRLLGRVFPIKLSSYYTKMPRGSCSSGEAHGTDQFNQTTRQGRVGGLNASGTSWNHRRFLGDEFIRRTSPVAEDETSRWPASQRSLACSSISFTKSNPDLVRCLHIVNPSRDVAEDLLYLRFFCCELSSSRMDGRGRCRLSHQSIRDITVLVSVKRDGTRRTCYLTFRDGLFSSDGCCRRRMRGFASHLRHLPGCLEPVHGTTHIAIARPCSKCYPQRIEGHPASSHRAFESIDSILANILVHKDNQAVFHVAKSFKYVSSPMMVELRGLNPFCKSWHLLESREAP